MKMRMTVIGDSDSKKEMRPLRSTRTRRMWKRMSDKKGH